MTPQGVGTVVGERRSYLRFPGRRKVITQAVKLDASGEIVYYSVEKLEVF